MLLRRLRYWLGSAKREALLREEMELHVEEKAAELRERGLTEAEALTEARRRFGNLGLKQEDAREIWIARYWSDFWKDMQYGARSLAGQPGFTIAALLALILGIGVNVILFNVYNALAFAPWAIRDPGETVQIWVQRGGNWSGVSWPHFRYLQENMRSFDGLVAFSGDGYRITQGDTPWSAEVVETSENYFDVIGTGFEVGRGFSAEAGNLRNPAPETVLQHETWLARFGGDPAIVGTWIDVGGRQFQVAGVAAAGFHGASATKTNLWIPGAWHDILRPDESTMDNPDECCVSLIARLRRGVTRDAAQAEVSAVSTRFLDGVGQDYTGPVVLTTPSFMANPARFDFFFSVFLPIAAAFLLILLLACANVANLQLARTTARRREIAVRLSLGASRGRILRQLLVESLLLSGLAGVASVAISAWVPAWIFQAIAGTGENLVFRFDTDVRVVAFILFATFAAAMLFGLIPAVSAVRGTATASLREGLRATSRGRLRPILLAAQVALCAILLSGTALLVRSLDNVHRTDTGIQSANVIVMSTGLGSSNASDEQARGLLAAFAGRAASLPGVESVAWTNMIPLGDDFNDTSLTDPRTQEEVEVGTGQVSASFFATLQIPLTAGRLFTPADEATGNAAIVNEAMAQRLWPGESALGRTLQFNRSVEVIGVVRNFSTEGVGSEEYPYVWTASRGNVDARILIRHSGLAGPLLNDLPKQAGGLDPRFLASAVPYSETIAQSQRFATISTATASVLGGLCLLLACVGIYGVATYNVAQRTREFGVRMALGAPPRRILAMVLQQNLRAVAVGAAIGMAGAIAFGHLLASLLYGVNPTDPVAMLATIAILLGTSILAVAGPARRSSRVDPAITLRHE